MHADGFPLLPPARDTNHKSEKKKCKNAKIGAKRHRDTSYPLSLSAKSSLTQEQASKRWLRGAAERRGCVALRHGRGPGRAPRHKRGALAHRRPCPGSSAFHSTSQSQSAAAARHGVSACNKGGSDFGSRNPGVTQQNFKNFRHFYVTLHFCQRAEFKRTRIRAYAHLGPI